MKEYMWDLVEQARQEEQHDAFGYKAGPYRPHHAISDLLAALDDRMESEGSQVGLPEGLLHEMWTICNEAQSHIKETVWLESNLETAPRKSRTRELTYQALLDFIQRRAEE